MKLLFEEKAGKVLKKSLKFIVFVSVISSGSHLSGTCSLKEDSEITPDQTWCVRVLDSNDMIRKAVYNWSKVQTMSIKQQVLTNIIN